jgi:hypothetical protein
MVRLLHLFVVAIFAVIGLGAAKPAPVFTTVAASLEVPASTDTVRVARWVAAPSTSQRCQNEDERALDQIGPVEESLDDDDDVDGRDAHLARAEATFPAFDITRFEPNAGRAFRSESSIDPSRFAIGCGFARGPPRARV